MEALREKLPGLIRFYLCPQHQTKEYPGCTPEDNERLQSWSMKILDG